MKLSKLTTMAFRAMTVMGSVENVKWMQLRSEESIDSLHFPLGEKWAVTRHAYLATTIPGGVHVPFPTGRTDSASVAGFGQYRRMTK